MLVGIPCGFRCCAGDDDDVDEGVELMMGGNANRDRRYHLQTYKNCFVGREAVSWMVRTGYAGTRYQALVAMNELHRLGVISHVTNDHVVEDKEYFYRLEEAALKAEPGAPSVAMCPASTLPQDEISSAFLSVDAIAQKEEKYQTCGSTAINLFVVAGETGSRSILCAWTGDSRAAYFSGSDLHEFGHLSNDHDPTSVAERRRIDQYGKEKGGAFVARRTTQGGALGPWAVFKNTPEVGGLSLMMTRSIGDARHSKAIVPDPEFKRIQAGESPSSSSSLSCHRHSCLPPVRRRVCCFFSFFFFFFFLFFVIIPPQ